jgi:uncharacterized membrane protein YkgB
VPLITNAVLIVRAVLALVFLWFGAMNFTPVGEATVAGWISGHAFLSGLTAQASAAAMAIGFYQILMAVLIGAPIPSGSFRRIGFLMLGGYAGLALTLMLTNPVWLDAAGGFPAIGSGQGIIKYVSILGLAFWGASFDNSRLFSQRESVARSWGRHLMWGGLVLVLAWIGAMKFTLAEAQGIDPLIQTSPFFSWMPVAFDFQARGGLPILGWFAETSAIQVTSYVIGLIELATVAALAGYWFNNRLYYVGLALSAVTFVLTLSFLITFSGAWAPDLGGFPALARSGHFLLKDLALLAACIALYAERRDVSYR